MAIRSSKFKFKSSGKLITARELKDPVVITSPIGIKTPLEFSVGRRDEDFYKMHFNAAHQIRDNFRNLLMTNFGERLGRSGLGADLKSLLYDMTSIDSIEAAAVERISITAQKSLPMVQIKDTQVSFVGLDTETKDIASGEVYNMMGASLGLSGMRVLVKYDIPRLGVTDQAVEVTLTIGG